MKSARLLAFIAASTILWPPSAHGNELTDPCEQHDIDRCMQKLQAVATETGTAGMRLKACGELNPDGTVPFEVILVREGGAAQKAGIEVGDKITSFNGRQYTREELGDFLQAHKTLKIGDTVTYNTVRGGKQVEKDLKVARPSEAQVFDMAVRELQQFFGRDEVAAFVSSVAKESRVP